MRYLETFRQAWSIAWRRPYLWFLAFLAGEGTYWIGNGSSGRTSTGSPSSESWQRFWDFVGANLGGIAAFGLLLLALGIVCMLISAVATGGVIHGVTEQAADRPSSLGPAWSAGARSGARIFWMRVLVAVFVVTTLAIVLGLGLITAALAFGGATAAAVGLGIFTGMLFIAAAIFWFLLSLASVLGVRAIALDGLGAQAGLRRGFSLIRQRPGRVLLFWLLLTVICTVAGLAALLALGLVAAPFAIAAIAIAPHVSSTFALFLVPLVVLWGFAALVLVGLIEAFASASWTLAYKRFEETSPAVVTRPLPA